MRTGWRSGQGKGMEDSPSTGMEEFGMRKWISGGVLVALVFVLVGCKVVVTPNALNGWFFANEGPNGSVGTGYFVNGPGNPPAGRGSALLTIDGTARESIASTNYSGQALAPFTHLSYSTYQAYSGSAQEAPTLAFDVDYDSSDSSTAYQGRLVFVPSQSSAVQPNTWQTWDTMSGPAAWYSSGSGPSTTFRPIVGDVADPNPPCTQASFCTWQTLMATYPNARIRPTVNNVPGVLLLRAGGPVTNGFSGAVDNFVIGISGTNVENNFEPGDGAIAVKPANAASLGFAFAQETGSGGTGAFVSGPNGSDGTGSARLKVDTPSSEGLVNGLYSGTPFNKLTFLSYKTYSKAPGGNAPTLQLDADYDSTDATTTFQGRAVFEPSLAGEGPVTAETWQTWNPLTAASGWWQTGTPIVGDVAGTKACTQGSPCSFQQLLAAYPNAQIRTITGQSSGQPKTGGMWLKVGSNWGPNGYDGNVDSLTIGVKVGTVNGTATYDFEG
jgi:hypothetical protein